MSKKEFDLSPIDFKIPNSEITIKIGKLPQKVKDKQSGLWIEVEPKPYMQVAQRLVWFNHEKSDWVIETEIESEFESASGQRYVRFKCSIKTPDGLTKRVARKTTQILSALDYDKCETGAIGRCLALLGYGTQYAQDDLEDDIVDAPTNLKTENKSEQKKETQKPLPKINPDIEKLGQTKFTAGIYAGKSFEEVFKLELSSEHKWSQTRIKELKEGKNVPEIAVKYLDYAQSLGVRLV